MNPDLSTLTAELNENEAQRSWSAMYMDLLVAQEQLDYTIDAAISRSNMYKNRYRDVLPSDQYRVRLNRQPDYINANRCVVSLDDLGISKSYIMSQGPMEETSGDFWEMVWQENCKDVIMLTNTIENRMIKCHQYFPDLDSPKSTYKSVIGTFTVRLLEKKKSPDFTVRKFSLELSEHEEIRTITHFHYTNWPDHGVPENPVSFVKFFFYLSSLKVLPDISNHESENSDESSLPPPPPPVIHCSAGIGRTGVLCVADSCYTLLKNSRDVNLEKITDIIMSLRQCRKGAVQTPEQLRFVCFAVCAIGQAIADDMVDSYIADASSSLEICTKAKNPKQSQFIGKPDFQPNIKVPLPPLPARVGEGGSRSSASAPAPREDVVTVPARRSLDSRLSAQEFASKKRRTNFLSQNWYFWALTKLQGATGNRQGLAVVTFCVAAFAVGVGLWKRTW